MSYFMFTRIRPRLFTSDAIWGQLKPTPDWLPPYSALAAPGQSGESITKRANLTGLFHT